MQNQGSGMTPAVFLQTGREQKCLDFTSDLQQKMFLQSFYYCVYIYNIMQYVYKIVQV